MTADTHFYAVVAPGPGRAKIERAAKDGDSNKIRELTDELAAIDQGKGHTDTDRGFRGVPASELQKHIGEEVDWLVDNVFGLGEIALFLAKSKCGKTMLLTDFVTALSTGRPGLNCDRLNASKQRNVLFVTGEANARRAAEHLNNACLPHGTTLAGVGDSLRVEVAKFPAQPDIRDCTAITRDVALAKTGEVLARQYFNAD